MSDEIVNYGTSSAKEKYLKPNELFNLFDPKTRQGYTKLRPIGNFVSFAEHWVQYIGDDGKWYAKPLPCTKFNPEVGDYDDTRSCAVCDVRKKLRKVHKDGLKINTGSYEKDMFGVDVKFIQNVIVRDDVDDVTPKIATDEERESGFIKKSTKSRTPVQVWIFSNATARKVNEVQSLNAHSVPLKKDGKKSKETRIMPLSHKVYGRDIIVKFDDNQIPANKYSVQKDDANALTEEELNYLVWDIQSYAKTKSPEDAEKAIADSREFLAKTYGKFLNDFDLETYIENAGSTEEPEVKKPKQKKKVKDEDIAALDDIDDGASEVEVSTKKKKKDKVESEVKKKKEKEPEPEPVVEKKKDKKKKIEEDPLGLEDEPPVAKSKKSKSAPIDDLDDLDVVEQPKKKKDKDEPEVKKKKSKNPL